MTRKDKALEVFDSGFNCAQSVLLAFAEELGLDPEKALKIASGFGGGMGAMGATCGAVTGSFMVIGLDRGNASGDDRETKDATYRMIRQFAREFEQTHGSIACRVLLGCDISSYEGYHEALTKDLFRTLCPRYVETAVTILSPMLGR
ncbi:MAG: C-GCAxxG-C-C family protein [Syntrophorhabdaceae bacterium]|nr:C-GCAxxG-C-C family protein [Syntrophorhabdaceae bacterium]